MKIFFVSKRKRGKFRLNGNCLTERKMNKITNKNVIEKMNKQKYINLCSIDSQLELVKEFFS